MTDPGRGEAWDAANPSGCAWFIGCTIIGAYYNRLLTWMVLGFVIGLFISLRDLMTIPVTL